MKRYSKNIIEICKENWFVIIIAILSVFILFMPNLPKGIIAGSDSPFHLARIDSLKVEIMNGNFPAKVHSALAYNYGYGVGVFYQNYLLYIPALLRVLGLSLELSYEIFALLLISGMYLSAFYSTYQIVEDKYAATLSAIGFIYSYQVLNTFYYDFSLGSTMGIVFMPLAIAGMIVFCVKDKSPILLGLGFLGLACTHTISAYMVFVICLIILIVYSKKLIKKPIRILQLALAAGCVLALTISFWLPMWEQFRQQIYKIAAPWAIPENNIITIKELFSNSSFGWVLFICFFLCGINILVKQRELSNKKLINTLFLIIIGIMLVQVLKPFWVVLRPVFNMIQFPRRFMIVGAVLLIFMIALLAVQSKFWEKYKKIIIILYLFVTVCVGIGTLYSRGIRYEDYSNRVIYNEIAGIGAGEEWLPLETTREMLTTPNLATADDGFEVIGEKQRGRFTFKADSKKEYYDVPFVWYRGYKAVVSSGEELRMDKNPQTSLTRIYMPKEGNWEDELTITVWYDKTKIQKLSYTANIISALLVVGAIIAWNTYFRKKYS